MTNVRTAAHEAAEDLFFGQTVILWARWFVVLGAVIAALWSADTSHELSLRVLLAIGLMAVNVTLHGRYLVGRPANYTLLAIAAGVDLAIIGAIVGLWDPHGLDSPYFVFFYPMLFAVALVFPPTLAIAYGIVALVLYSGLSVVSGNGIDTSSDLKRLVMRLITMAAAVGLGTFYWRIQRDRRRKAQAQRRALIDESLGLVDSAPAG